MKDNKISIVIPTHNRCKLLKRILNSIENQKILPEEVIIINDGSRDETKAFLEVWEKQNHKFLPIVFNNPISQGPGRARNIGIQLASGDTIAFTDDDCIVHPSWIKSIRNSKLWNKNKIVGIGGRVLPYRRGIVSNYYTFHRILEPPRYNQYLVTANACYLKHCLINVGGFDETHNFPGGEDNGLSFKLTNVGYVLGFEKNMVVFHDYKTSLLSFLKTFYRYGKGCAEITYKYFKNVDKTMIEV